MNNDEKIIKLKQQIEEKRNELGKLKKFTPITNCILEWLSFNPTRSLA